ncbi:MAG: DoxX family membrane protein [Promicromonosporaceae bacterium]|nr:DoxX family membrane protein [Promicromonosporaceae bacterium]
MSLRRLARPLLAAPFVYDGVRAITKPDVHVATARAALEKLATRTDAFDEVTDQQLKAAVRAHAGATAILGVALGAGVFPRAAAAGLAALTLPLVAANLPVTEKDKTARQANVQPFVTSLGRLGGALFASSDPQGRPSLAYRVAQARAHRADVNAAVRSALAASRP